MSDEKGASERWREKEKKEKETARFRIRNSDEVVQHITATLF